MRLKIGKCLRDKVIIAAVLLVSLVAESQGQTNTETDTKGPSFATAFSRLSAATFRDIPDASVNVSEHQLKVDGLGFSFGQADFEAGIDYQYTRFEFQGISGRDRDLHRLQFPVNFALPLSQWHLEGYVAPSVSTSSNVFKDLVSRGTHEDFFVSTRFAGKRETNFGNVFFGLAYDRLFGEATLYPVIGTELKPSTSLTLRVAFPNPGLQYQISDRIDLYGDLFPAGHQWHVVRDDFNSEFDYRVKAFRAQLGLGIRVWKALHVDVFTGHEFRREHEFMDDLGLTIDSRLDNQWLLGVGIRLGPGDLPLTHGGHL